MVQFETSGRIAWFMGMAETKRFGGAGGIRTHEWRFCRPLPWATWVPRRNFKYSEILSECQGVPGQSKTENILFLHCWRGSRNLRFSQEPRRFLPWRGIDVETRPPFVSRYLRQLRDDFNMPVIVIIDLFPDRRSVDHEVVSTQCQHNVEPHQRVFQPSRQTRRHTVLFIR